MRRIANKSKGANIVILVMFGVWYLMSRYATMTANHTYTVTTPYQNDMNIVNVLIIAYFRSGSTFLGSMFDANTDIFYTFEPLRAVEVAKQSNTGVLKYLEGNSRPTGEETYLKTISDIFKCHLEQLSIDQLTDPFWHLSKTGIQYRQCLNMQYASRHETVESIRACLPQLVVKCRSTSIGTIKTIRFPMSAVQELLEANASLKVIHLVRDPRPSIHSQMKMHFNRDGHIQRDLEEYSRRFCEKIFNDIFVTIELLTLYPNRVKLLFYEDLTPDTLEVVQELYGFLGLSFRNEVINHINKLKSIEETNCVFCLGRGNVTHQLVKWRLEMNLDEVHVIEKSCKDLMDVLGFIPSITEARLRDVSFPLRGPMKISQ